MTYNTKTTLNRIREGSPDSGRACQDGYAKLLSYLGKTRADDEPVDLLQVLDSNGLDDALWVLSYAMPDDRLDRHFQAWCAEQVLHKFEQWFPGDMRVRDQIAMLRNDGASDEERSAARAAARSAAWSAEQDAAREAARASALVATRDAECEAARDAAQAAARDTAWGASWSATRGSACEAQEAKLREMIANA